MTDPTVFLQDVQRWLSWVTESNVIVDRMVKVAESKPRGLHHGSNLILAQDGSVWESRGSLNGFAELTRSEVYGEYRRTGRVIGQDKWRAYNGRYSNPFTVEGVTFVAQGSEQPEADWCWVPDRYQSGGSLGYWLRSQRHNQDGIAFGKAVLSLAPEAIGAWIQRQADAALVVGNRRDSESIDSDWRNFLRAFGLPTGSIPDNGSMTCLLHVLVDRAAGVTGTSYAY